MGWKVSVGLMIEADGLWDGLSAAQLAEAQNLLSLNNYARGEYLFHAGDSAAHIYQLLDGIVKVSYFNPGGDEKIINIFQTGDIFGHLFLGQYRHRIGTAQALTDVRVARVSESNLKALLERFPSIALNLISYMADEQRHTLARLHALMHVEARYRLLGTLLHLARRYCCTQGDWSQLPAAITQEDIAKLACLNRSTVNIHINTLRAEGVLGGKGRSVTVNRPAVEAVLRAVGLEILE